MLLLLGLGIASMFVSAAAISVVLMPGLAFLLPGVAALERRKYALAGPCLLIGNLWTCAVMTAWSVGCFAVVFRYYTPGSFWPYLLWAYGMATGLWTHMASKGGPDDYGSKISAFGACCGAIAIMAVLLLRSQTSLIEAALAFCIPILAVLAFQIVITVKMVSERGRATICP